MVETREDAAARDARRKKAAELAASCDASADAAVNDARRALMEESGFDPTLFERLEPAAGAHGRAIFLTLGVAAATGVATLAAAELGLDHRLAVLAAMPVGVAAGFLFALGLVLGPVRRAQEHQRRLIERINAVAHVDREEAFALLLQIDQHHELSDLAHTIHNALSSAHKDRLEAARLRRELSFRIEKESQKHTAVLSRLSETDELTGILNRRGFERAITEMVQNARRNRTEATLVALDMDHFKKLNDTCGHATGDQALRIVSELMRAAIRAEDFAARTGGDELVLGLPGADAHQARRVVHRIMELFSRHPAGQGLPAPWPTVSAGIASLNADAAGSAAELRKIADERLYASKRNGRGRCS